MKNSNYCYSGTTVLKNVVEIYNYEQLQRYESLVTTSRLIDLQLKPIYGNFDQKHLQKIHQYIFQDVYSFSGQIREVDISKPGMLFARTIHIAEQSKEIFTRLKNEKFLIGLEATKFSKRAAEYMADINVLHPFREGNGRSTREFIRTLALNAGYHLQWVRIEPSMLFDASVKSSVASSEDLADQIRMSISNEMPDRAISSAYKELKRGKN